MAGYPGNHVDPKQSTATATSTSTTKFAVKDFAITLDSLNMRESEALDSDVVSELPGGTTIEIIGLGADRRIKVRTEDGKGEGWISSRTAENETLIAKFEVFEQWGQCELLSAVTVRAAESIESDVIPDASLSTGQCIQILQNGVETKRRVKVLSIGPPQPGVEGWISIATTDGEQLVGKASRPPPSQSKTKGLLSGMSGLRNKEKKQVVTPTKAITTRGKEDPAEDPPTKLEVKEDLAEDQPNKSEVEEDMRDGNEGVTEALVEGAALVEEVEDDVHDGNEGVTETLIEGTALAETDDAEEADENVELPQVEDAVKTAEDDEKVSNFSGEKSPGKTPAKKKASAKGKAKSKSSDSSDSNPKKTKSAMTSKSLDTDASGDKKTKSADSDAKKPKSKAKGKAKAKKSE